LATEELALPQEGFVVVLMVLLDHGCHCNIRARATIKSIGGICQKRDRVVVGLFLGRRTYIGSSSSFCPCSKITIFFWQPLSTLVFQVPTMKVSTPLRRCRLQMGERFTKRSNRHRCVSHKKKKASLARLHRSNRCVGFPHHFLLAFAVLARRV
jgi:hypothetical protein